MMSFSNPNGCLYRWMLAMSELDFTIQYRPELNNQVTDALLRCITEEPRKDEEGVHLQYFGDGRIMITTRFGIDMKREENEEDIYEEEVLDEARFEFNLGRDEGELLAPIMREEMIIAQGADEFCREVLARQVAEDRKGAESPDGFLVKGNDGDVKERILVP